MTCQMCEGSTSATLQTHILSPYKLLLWWSQEPAAREKVQADPCSNPPCQSMNVGKLYNLRILFYILIQISSKSIPWHLTQGLCLDIIVYYTVVICRVECVVRSFIMLRTMSPNSCQGSCSLKVQQ